MNKIAVIDYGMGNLHSVAKALEHVGRELNESVEVIVTADSNVIAEADRVIFPGVGAIRDCMAEIRRLDVDQIVKDAIHSKPVLAICVGMQALMSASEENGGVECLGFLDGEVRYFGDDLRGADGQRLKVPHMGWNQVSQSRDHPLWKDVPDNSRFYFVHSYYVEAQQQGMVTGTTNYGHDFVAALADSNIFAVQFHPEKSQTVGLTLLRNFLLWDGTV
ncbi:MAG: imidazole glycerol phosphate synthase subunit HisH [Gammaproteobacteria bacterium]|nr:imidazole glycerol phosphate synthase subunit HisH [Gammaproteobacteria bacterium]